MEAFLQQVARQLLENHPDDMRSVTVVFNNHRSALFLKKHFANLHPKSCFLPKIISIDDLVMELGQTKIIPNEFLLFELFKIHMELTNGEKKFKTFDEFISFGEMMIADFSEIDQYRVDAKALFSNLYDLKELGEWKLESEMTVFQKDFLNFYKSLYEYYTRLRQQLAENNQAYNGMAYRMVADNIEKLVKDQPQMPIYFVGFNAMSACETAIIQEYVKCGMGHLFTDGDKYYYDDPDQEAGMFLRKHKKHFESEIGNYEEHFNKGKKTIHIIKCPENILQTKYAAEILKNGSVAPEDTALVLADESLLMPMLNSLPSNITNANISMGFPFVGSGAHSLVIKLFTLYARAKGDLFYHQDVVDILSDFYICRLLNAKNIRSRLIQHMAANNIVRTDKSRLEEILSTLNVNIEPISSLFENAKPSPNDFLKIVGELAEQLHTAKVAGVNVREAEALGNLAQIVHHLKDIQKKYEYITNLGTLQKIYTKLAQRHNIAFFGKPLLGLQILGVLETRNLDFKKVVMLSVNEGMIPSGRGNNTLIPIQLKRFGNNPIPTYVEKDAVYAYHFFRFLQRADEIYLIYNGESDGMGKGEPSRFILQICDELKEKYPDNIDIKTINVSASRQDSDQSSLVRKKDQHIMSRLDEINTKGFSPSSLNTYRSCPMKFFYENVMGAKDLNEVNDDLDQSQLGSCIHKVLEDIYKPYKGKAMPIKALQSARKGLKETIKKQFEQTLENGDVDEGKNYLLQEIAFKEIDNFLDKEIQILKTSSKSLKVIDVEMPLSRKLILNEKDGEASIAVNIAGIADRVDLFDNQVRLIDYKTGGVEDKELKIGKKGGRVPDKLFQLMTYCWMYSKTPISAWIAPLRKLNGEYMPAQWNGCIEITQEHVNDFENELRLVTGEIMDPEKPFVANKKCGVCEFCDMKPVCK